MLMFIEDKSDFVLLLMFLYKLVFRRISLFLPSIYVVFSVRF